MVQVILTIVILIVIAGVVFLMYRARVNERPSAEYQSCLTIEALGELVSQELAEAVRDDDLLVTSDTHFKALAHKKRSLAKALDECVYGVEKAKNIVLSSIREIVERELPEVQDCLEVVDFNDIYYTDPDIQWELLIYLVKKHHKTNAMSYICDKYDLAKERDIGNEIIGGINKLCLFNADFLSRVFEEK